MTIASGDVPSTWRGVHFFVSADVLFTFEGVKPLDLEGQLGRPQRRIALLEGKAHPVTSYPAASFFLKTLKATGNAVTVVAPWKPQKTTSLLRLFGWDAFDDVRAVYPEPGKDVFVLSSLDCPLEEYALAVIVTPSRAVWHTALWSQIVEVRHCTKCLSQSLALLRALSCCRRIAECRLRFPHIAVSSCFSLCRSKLFSQYRFFLSPELMKKSDVAMMINEHGGYLVHRYEDATHYVVDKGGDELVCTLKKPRLMPQDEERESTASCSTSESSSASSDDINGSEEESELSWEGGSNEETWRNDKDVDCNEEEEEEKEKSRVKTIIDLTTQEIATATKPEGISFDTAVSHLNLPVADPPHGAEVNGDKSRPAPPPSPTKTASNAITATVTVHWLHDCIDGMVVYPTQVAHSTSDSTQWNVSTLLLAALLPPSDVEPISLSCINDIAESHGFSALKLSQAVGEVNLASLLQKQWGALLDVEVRGMELFLRQSSVSISECGLEMERHLAFVAEQFSKAWSIAIRNKRLRNMFDSGTQTAVILTTNAETNTDVIAPSNSEGPTSVEPPSQGRALLVRALAPAEWAKEVDASHMTYQTAQAKEPPASLVPTPAAPVSTIPVPVPAPVAATVPTIPTTTTPVAVAATLALGSEIRTGWGTQPKLNEVVAMGGETKALNGYVQHGGETDAVEQATVDSANSPANEDKEFFMCFIPTESLQGQITLDKDHLLRQPPFRNYPMKLSVDKKGIHCLFVTSFDAKRFSQEGYTEIGNRFLPIFPDYGDTNTSTASGRKRRQTQSLATKHTAGGSKKGRKEASSSNREPQSSRNASSTLKGEEGNDNYELSKTELELLTEIGATLDFARENVDVIERYALVDLADPVFRQQQQQLIRVVAKLRGTREKDP